MKKLHLEHVSIEDSKKVGFTLIEVLVVISIIAIMVAFVSSNFLGARQRAKDVKKKAEFRQMKNALRLFYNDYNVYPSSPAAGAVNTFKGCKTGATASDPPNQDCLLECSGIFGIGATCSDEVYMKLLPPWSEYRWDYQQVDAGADYCLWTTLENVSDPEIAKSHLRCTAACPITMVASTDYVVCAD